MWWLGSHSCVALSSDIAFRVYHLMAVLRNDKFKCIAKTVQRNAVLFWNALVQTGFQTKRSNRIRLTEKRGSHLKVDALKEEILEEERLYILTLSSS